MDAEMQNHLAQITEVVGRRIDLLDRVGIPAGWVVTSKVPNGFWNKCKTYAIPLESKRVLGLFPSPATVEKKRWLGKYGKDIMVVLIPDEESFEMYSGGPILLKDLERDPNVLLDESLACIGKDNTLVDMKRRCAMLLLGWVDTK
jgi:hypothetical protein